MQTLGLEIVHIDALSFNYSPRARKILNMVEPNSVVLRVVEEQVTVLHRVQVILANGAGFVSNFFQSMQVGICIKWHGLVTLPNIVVMRIQSSRDRGTCWHAEGACRIGACEPDPLLCKGIYIGRTQQRVTSNTQAVCTELVRHQEKNVWSV